jgi:hypothetical protein
LRDKELYINRGEDDVKGPHAEGSKSTIDREASRREMGPNRAETGMGRSAKAGWPGLFWDWFVTPFDLGVYKRATKADVGRRESLKLSR